MSFLFNMDLAILAKGLKKNLWRWVKSKCAFKSKARDSVGDNGYKCWR